MPFKLRFSGEASALLKLLEAGDPNQQAKLKKVRRALARLEQNPRHPGLHSHQYESFPVDTAVKVWDSYVENQTPGAWRIFWRYGPDEEQGSRPVITVLAIGPHPLGPDWLLTRSRFKLSSTHGYPCQQHVNLDPTSADALPAPGSRP